MPLLTWFHTCMKSAHAHHVGPKQTVSPFQKHAEAEQLRRDIEAFGVDNIIKLDAGARSQPVNDSRSLRQRKAEAAKAAIALKNSALFKREDAEADTISLEDISPEDEVACEA